MFVRSSSSFPGAGVSLVSLRMCSRCVRRWRRTAHSQAPTLQRLVEIGRLETPTIHDEYLPGQFFLHRVFGYRGVVLFSWLARVYDRDAQGGESSHVSWEEEGLVHAHLKGLRGETKTHYQVLIDHRDFSYIRTQPEAITLLADKNNSSIYSIPGLDYVAHEDILPYTASDQESFHHELFSQFLTPGGGTEGTYVPRETLRVWRDNNHQWLEHTDVHRETTQGVRVTVMPFYMGRRELQQQGTVYWWRYNIRLENLGGERVQLRERHWRIFSVLGTLETIKGRGVIGQEPILSVTHPAFQYSSHVSLQYPSGHMWGTFRMEKPDGSSFDIRVPPFTLEVHEEKGD